MSILRKYNGVARGWGVVCLMWTELQFYKMKSYGMDARDCGTLWMRLMPLSCPLKNEEDAQLHVCVFYPNTNVEKVWRLSFLIPFSDISVDNQAFSYYIINYFHFVLHLLAFYGFFSLQSQFSD